jgi:hypothetical protein
VNRLPLYLLLALSLSLLARAASAQQETPTGTPESSETAQGTPAQVIIGSPSAGQALQGNISISGTTDLPGFQSSELTFAYSQDSTNTWFLIAESNTPVREGELARWDTTTLTDGEYALRLVVNLADGGQVSARVPDLRVRNYTPIETDTPTPVTPTTTPLPGDTPVPTDTPTPTITPIPPTATALPPNPLQTSTQSIMQSFGKGILVIIGFFALIGIYRVVQGLRARE